MCFFRKIYSVLFAIVSFVLASILFIISVSFPIVSKSDVNMFYKLLIIFFASTTIKNIILVLYFIKKQKLPYCIKKIISVDFIFSGVCFLLTVFYLVVGIANGLQTFTSIIFNIVTLFVGAVFLNGYNIILHILINKFKRKSTNNTTNINWLSIFDRRMVVLIIAYTLNLFFIFLLQLFTFVFMITHKQPSDLVYLITIAGLNIAVLVVCSMFDLLTKKDIISIMLVDILCMVPYGTLVMFTANDCIPVILMFYVCSIAGAIIALFVSQIKKRKTGDGSLS